MERVDDIDRALPGSHERQVRVRSVFTRGVVEGASIRV